MLTRKYFIDKCIKKLSILKYYAKSNTKINRCDVTIDLENFCAGLLEYRENACFNNTNYIKRNYPGIDLIDNNLGIAVQVTVDNCIEKIKDTIDKFDSNDVLSNYNKLIIFIVGEKKKYRNIPTKKYTLEIIDLESIISWINNLEINLLNEVHRYFELNFINLDIINSDTTISINKNIGREMIAGETFLLYLKSKFGNCDKEDLNYILSLYEKLKLLSRKSRELLSCLFELPFREDYPHIVITLQDIESGINSIDQNELRELLNYLIDKKIIFFDEDYSYRSVDSIVIEPIGYDYGWSNILNYLEGQRISYKTLLVELDFSVFD